MTAIAEAEPFRPSSQVQESAIIAGEVRAIVARRGQSMREFARTSGLDAMWLSRRVGGKASVQMTIEDIGVIAAALDISVLTLIQPWLATEGERPAAPGGGQAFLPLDEAGAPSGTRTPNPLIPSQLLSGVVVPFRALSLQGDTRQGRPDTLRPTARTRHHLRLVDEAAS